MPMYWLAEEVTCSECLGTGYVTHSGWKEFHTEVDPESMTCPDDLREWFRSKGYEEVPEEKIPCEACSGVGHTYKLASLRDALENIGIEIPPQEGF